MEKFRELLEYPESPTGHNVTGDGERDGLKTVGIGQSAAKPSPKGAEGSETTTSSLRDWPNRDILFRWYFEDGMSTNEIADRLSRSASGIHYHLTKKLGFVLRNNANGVHQRCSRHMNQPHLLGNEKWLRNAYADLGFSTFEIAEVIGCNRKTVVEALHKYGIDVRYYVYTSESHRRLVRALTATGIEIVDSQVDCRIPGTRWIGDIVWKELKLDIEVDGYYHSLPDRKKKDVERDVILRSDGWTVVRVSASDAWNHTDDVACELADLIWRKSQERGTSHVDDDIVRTLCESKEKAELNVCR